MTYIIYQNGSELDQRNAKKVAIELAESVLAYELQKGNHDCALSVEDKDGYLYAVATDRRIVVEYEDDNEDIQRRDITKDLLEFGVTNLQAYSEYSSMLHNILGTKVDLSVVKETIENTCLFFDVSDVIDITMEAIDYALEQENKENQTVESEATQPCPTVHAEEALRTVQIIIDLRHNMQYHEIIHAIEATGAAIKEFRRI